LCSVWDERTRIQVIKRMHELVGSMIKVGTIHNSQKKYLESVAKYLGVNNEQTFS